MKKREIKYDYLRALAVLAIIMVHTIPEQAGNSLEWWVVAGVVPVLLCFVGIYFMLSGLFFLNAGTENIPQFYWNRVRMIVVPFVFYCGIYYGYDVITTGIRRTPVGHVAEFGKELMEGTIPLSSHMWFMYVIMALYLCTPFLARMMGALKDKELKLLLLVMLVIQGLSTYMNLFGIDVGSGFQYMIFKGWVIYFLLGYACKRLCDRRMAKWLMAAGVAGFFITLFQKKFTPAYTPGIHDLALTMVAMSTGVFLFFEFYGDWKQKTLGKLVSFLSRHSYSTYLIHFLVLNGFVRGAVQRMGVGNQFFLAIILETVLTFFISLGIAFAVDTVILTPIQNRMKIKTVPKIQEGKDGREK